MDLLALIFFAVAAWALWMSPRRWAPLPLLVGCCYMTMGQGVHLGPFSLPIYRMLLAVGLVRVISKGERISGGLNAIDKLLIAWSCWLLFASLFHLQGPGSGTVFSLGVMFNIFLMYFLIRTWCNDPEQIADLTKMVALLLMPVALEMVCEKLTGKNLFAVFGGVPLNVIARSGRLRAQGPFRHPILAGTVGATCFPLMIGIWRQHRKRALVGIAACILMVVASASSGPVMSLLLGVFALFMWRFRYLTRAARWTAVVTYIILNVCMSRPAYYLISRIDLAGGSTGWQRSFLIDSTIKHFSDWWLVGTDYTLDWMPNQGIGAGDGRHTDLTDYYIVFGVMGGLASMLLVIAILWRAFRWVGIMVDSQLAAVEDDRFLIWSLGAGLFAHAATSFSVSYFDQSMMFFWMNVAVISSMYSTFTAAESEEATAEDTNEFSESFQAEGDGDLAPSPSSP